MNNRATGLPLLVSILLHLSLFSALALYEGGGPLRGTDRSRAEVIIVHLAEVEAGPEPAHKEPHGVEADKRPLARTIETSKKDTSRKGSLLSSSSSKVPAEEGLKKVAARTGSLKRRSNEATKTFLQKVSKRRPLKPPSSQKTLLKEDGDLQKVAAPRQSGSKKRGLSVAAERVVKRVSKRETMRPSPPSQRSLLKDGGAVQRVAERYKTGIRRKTPSEKTKAFLKKVSKRRARLTIPPPEPAVEEVAFDAPAIPPLSHDAEDETPPATGAVEDEAVDDYPVQESSMASFKGYEMTDIEETAEASSAIEPPVSKTSAWGPPEPLSTDGTYMEDELKDPSGPLQGDDTGDRLMEERDKVAHLNGGYDTHTSSVSTPAAIMVSKRPGYPWRSRLRGEEGTVVLEVEILPDGSRGRIKVIKSSGFSLLDRAAIKALERARFVPATRDGKGIKSRKKIAFTFRIEDRR